MPTLCQVPHGGIAPHDRAAAPCGAIADYCAATPAAASCGSIARQYRSAPLAAALNGASPVRLPRESEIRWLATAPYAISGEWTPWLHTSGAKEDLATAMRSIPVEHEVPGSRATASGSAVGLQRAIIAETFRRMEIKHVICVRSFHVTKSFHVMRSFRANVSCHEDSESCAGVLVSGRRHLAQARWRCCCARCRRWLSCRWGGDDLAVGPRDRRHPSAAADASPAGADPGWRAAVPRGWPGGGRRRGEADVGKPTWERPAGVGVSRLRLGLEVSRC